MRASTRCSTRSAPCKRSNGSVVSRRSNGRLRSSKPHIPERHEAESGALAQPLGMDETVIETVNVFPELFHCSGFAVFGKATKDGKLYHGRVLDYMTTIGLQDSATTFIVSRTGRFHSPTSAMRASLAASAA